MVFIPCNQIGIRNLTHHKVRIQNLDNEAFLNLMDLGCQDSKKYLKVIYNMNVIYHLNHFHRIINYILFFLFWTWNTFNELSRHWPLIKIIHYALAKVLLTNQLKWIHMTLYHLYIQLCYLIILNNSLPFRRDLLIDMLIPTYFPFLYSS